MQYEEENKFNRIWEDKKESSDNAVRYRCEQKVINRIDGVVASHSETQRELILTPNHNGNKYWFKVDAGESFVKISPENMLAALELVDKIDVIKSQAEVSVDPDEGFINRVLNLEDIREKWEKYKSGMYRKINPAADGGMDEFRQLDKFTDVVDAHFCDEPTFRKELTGKLFFDVFFDRYLVGAALEDCKFERTFHSFLFDQTPIEATITQAVSTDKETGLKKLSRYISFDDQRLIRYVRHHVMNIYRDRYQPFIKYNFTQYNFEFYHDTLLSEDGLPQDIKVNIIEEVRNNIEILVTYQIRRLK